jgi:hypothetical protein
MSRSFLLRMRNVPDKIRRENQNTLLCSINFFSQKSCGLWNNVEKFVIARQATGDNMEHAHCVLDTQCYKHTLTICNTHCFSITTTVARTPLNVTVYAHCLSLYIISPSYLGLKKISYSHDFLSNFLKASPVCYMSRTAHRAETLADEPQEEWITSHILGLCKDTSKNSDYVDWLQIKRKQFLPKMWRILAQGLSNGDKITKGQIFIHYPT